MSNEFMEAPQNDNPEPIIQKKRWGVYLLEFSMLFLAVFLGFVAENIREYKTERDAEKEYMISLLNDLKADVENIEMFQKQNLLTKENGDSLYRLLTGPDLQANTNSAYYFGRLFSSSNYFSMTDGTFKQLTNAGGLRLVKRKNVIDSIQGYQYVNTQVISAQELKESLLASYREDADNVFDVRVFESMVSHTAVVKPVGNPPLYSNNRDLINRLLMKVHYAKRANAFVMTLLERMRRKSLNLQQMISQEYGLE